MITLCGQILVSRTDDDPPPPRRVSVQNVPVCTFKTSPHMLKHMRVVPVHTGTFYMYTRRRGWRLLLQYFNVFPTDFPSVSVVRDALNSSSLPGAAFNCKTASRVQA